jgi:hypothetical protein
VLQPGDKFDVVTIRNKWDEDHDYFVTPTDHSGLPYCFAPNNNLPPVHVSIQDECHHARPVADTNHMFPKGSVRRQAEDYPGLYDDQAANALINLRGQWVDYRQHHDVYNLLFTGPRIPENRMALLGTLMMGVLGYVPEFSLDLSKGDEPSIVPLSKAQRRMLWNSGQLRVLSDSEVSLYLKQELLSVEADHISQKDKEDFLYSLDRDIKRRAGYIIAGQLLERVVEPIESSYQEAKAKELIPQYVRLGGKRYDTPRRAADFALAKLTHGRRAGSLLNDLRQRFYQGERRPFSVYFAEQRAA